MKSKAVRLRGINKAFGAQRVADDLTLDVEPGEFAVLLGESGCGKSTLLNIIAGLEPAASGRVFIGEEDVTDRDPGARNIAMVFQSFALYPTMSARQNIGFSLKVNGARKAEIERKVRDMAELLHIGHLLEKRPAQLSGGEQQRVAIARALVREPDLFLLDEPLSNLDAKMRTELRRELKQLYRRTGRTTIYVTHDQLEAMTLATRVAVMHQGRVQQFDLPHVIYSRPVNLFVATFVGSPAMNLIEGRLCSQDSTAAVQTRCNGIVLLPGLSIDAQLMNAEVVLGVRPEHIRVEQRYTPGAASARVQEVESTGSGSVVSMDTPVGTLLAQASGPCTMQADQNVSFSVDGAAVSVFSPVSGARLN